MKNKMIKILISSAFILTLMSQSIEFVSAASRYYQITYAAGSLGKFKTSYIQECKEVYGAKNVTQSKATGNVTIKVEAEKKMPNAPTAQDITLKDVKNQNQYYVLTSGWQPASTTVSENATFVVQYGALANGVEYSIRYVDITTKQDVATPVIARANSQEVMNAYAKNIDGYTFDNQTKSISLTNNAKDNVLTFYYTAKENTVVVDQIIENVVTRNQVVTIPNTNNIPNTTLPNPNDNLNNNDTTINDNETPLANGDEVKDETTIDDEKTPLSKGDELTKNNQMLYITMIGVGAVLLVIGVVVAIKRKNKA